MKTLKVQIDDKIMETLEKMAAELGMKTTTYVQMVLGLHVQKRDEPQ